MRKNRFPDDPECDGPWVVDLRFPAPRHDYLAIRKYMKEHNKKLEDLSAEEIEQFRLKPEEYDPISYDGELTDRLWCMFAQQGITGAQCRMLCGTATEKILAACEPILQVNGKRCDRERDCEFYVKYRNVE